MRVDRLVAEGRVEATWLPFELHPEVPRDGAPYPAWIAAARGRVDAVAAEVGLRLHRHDRMINTRLALSTAEFARDHGRYDDVRVALTKAHWDGSAELDRIDDLQRITAAAGLDPDALKRALDAGRYEAVLDRHRADAEAVGIAGIPAHIIGRRYLLMGAQPYEAFIEVLDALLPDREDSTAEARSGSEGGRAAHEQ